MSNPYADKPIEAPTGDEPVLVEINARMIPLVLRALDKYRFRRNWTSDLDFERGLQQINTLQEALLTGTTQIVDAIDRLYRLVDTALNATQYSSAPNPSDPTRPLVTPALPAAPPAAPPVAPAALRAQLARLHQLAENAATGAAYAAGAAMDGTPGLDNATSWRARLEALQGQTPGGWFGLGARPATLADVYKALRVGGEQDAAKIDTALEALSASSSVANVFGVVRGLLGDAVDTGLEGGILSVLIASSIANAATQGVLSSQLDRLIKSLDGGGLVAPGDNVLMALRGNVEAGTTRNVASLLDTLRTSIEASPDSAELLARLDEIIALVS